MKINTDITFIINFNVIFNKRFFFKSSFLHLFEARIYDYISMSLVYPRRKISKSANTFFKDFIFNCSRSKYFIFSYSISI